MTAPVPRISVVIPVFNGERHLSEALESVRSQGFDDLEMIVVNDGSTDDSAGVARRHGARVIDSERGGVARARNVGLAAARGELIAWLDADDAWTKDSLRIRVTYLEAHPEIDFVYGSMQEYPDPDRPPPDWLPPSRVADPVGLLPVFLIRRPACEQTGWFEETLTIGEDLDWISRLQDGGFHGVRLDAVLIRHRLHADSTMIRHAHDSVPALKTVVRRSLERKRQRSP
ncbi:MAG: glycosyltransferase family 2 protein [Solirubrobacteraceae bacterium]